MTPLQKTVLALVPHGDQGSTDRWQVAAATGLSLISAQRVLYHLLDAGYITCDEQGYYLRVH